MRKSWPWQKLHELVKQYNDDIRARGGSLGLTVRLVDIRPGMTRTQIYDMMETMVVESWQNETNTGEAYDSTKDKLERSENQRAELEVDLLNEETDRGVIQERYDSLLWALTLARRSVTTEVSDLTESLNELYLREKNPNTARGIR